MDSLKHITKHFINCRIFSVFTRPRNSSGLARFARDAPSADNNAVSAATAAAPAGWAASSLRPLHQNPPRTERQESPRICWPPGTNDEFYAAGGVNCFPFTVVLRFVSRQTFVFRRQLLQLFAQIQFSATLPSTAGVHFLPWARWLSLPWCR